MGFHKSQVIDDGDGGGKSLNTSNVSCSICIEPVTDNGDRSWAKLQCGHEFHLDCIGSAFNIKGVMQCPNCRKIEKGQWLFATGCHSSTDFSFEDWPHDEDLYDLGYSEMSFGVHWCPISAFPRLPSSFEEGDFPSTAYHDLLGLHASLAEHMPSSTHPCPYVTYYGPIHSASSSSIGSMSDSSSFSSHWGIPSGSNEMPNYSFPMMDTHHHRWEHHCLPFSPTGSRLSGHNQPSVRAVTHRSSRAHSDLLRSGSFTNPLIVNYSSGAHASSSTTSLMTPHYPGSASRDHDRARALQAYFQQPSTSPPVSTLDMTSTRNSHRPSLPLVGPLPLSPDHTAGFYIFQSGASSRNYLEVENPITSRFHTWERDCPANFLVRPIERETSSVRFHPPASGRSNSFSRRHGSLQNGS